MSTSKQVWCLAVITDKPDCLPSGKWMPPDQPQEIFGFRMAYFNPCDNVAYPNATRPRKLRDKCLGFYPVLEPFPIRPICAISPEDILTLALIPLSPLEALEEYQAQGLENFLAHAIRCYHLHKEPNETMRLSVAV